MIYLHLASKKRRVTDGEELGAKRGKSDKDEEKVAKIKPEKGITLSPPRWQYTYQGRDPFLRKKIVGLPTSLVLKTLFLFGLFLSINIFSSPK